MKSIDSATRRKIYRAYIGVFRRQSRIAGLKATYAAAMYEGDAGAADHALTSLHEVRSTGKTGREVNAEFGIAPSWFMNDIYNATASLRLKD